MHLLLLRIRIEELFRPKEDVLILDREQLSTSRRDHDLLYRLLEGRSVVVGSNHACIIEGFLSGSRKELRYNICTLPGGTEPIGLGNYGGS